MKEVKITKVQNGYIVEVTKAGLSIAKEPYENYIYVFPELVKAEEWLERFFGGEKL